MTTTLDKPAATPAPAALVDVHGVAELLTCSPQHVRRLADAGRMPRPVKLGSLIRWRRADLDGWLQAGCPNCRQAGGTR